MHSDTETSTKSQKKKKKKYSECPHKGMQNPEVEVGWLPSQGGTGMEGGTRRGRFSLERAFEKGQKTNISPSQAVSSVAWEERRKARARVDVPSPSLDGCPRVSRTSSCNALEVGLHSGFEKLHLLMLEKSKNARSFAVVARQSLGGCKTHNCTLWRPWCCFTGAQPGLSLAHLVKGGGLSQAGSFALLLS